jgi:hypothetical protein
MRHRFTFGAALAAAAAAVASAEIQQFGAAGDAATVTAALNAFRTSLGPLNANVPGSFGGGRREINWDGVPDALSSPNAFPGNFFNFTASPRARGVNFTTDGTHFETSAKATNPTSTPIDFGNVNPTYVEQFAAFTPERLFAPIGDNSMDVGFFVPGTVTVPAQVTGFGAIFTDVEMDDSTSIVAFDTNGDFIAEIPVPPAASGQFSFAGILVTSGARIGSIRIKNGSVALAAASDDSPRENVDVVAMDDFVYGEPISSECPYDLTGDGKVDGPDLAVVLGAFGQSGSLPADINLDGTVDSYDIAYILGGWGPCPG